MTDDAKFEDGAEKPLRLSAVDADDLTVIAAIVQDAVFPRMEMRFERKSRRFAILLNRFRWEDAQNAKIRKRDYERVQTVLVFDDILQVQTQGLDEADADMVFSLLSLSFDPGEDGTGRISLILAGDGVIALDVEAVNVVLRDVTRPYTAPSGQAPSHPE